MAGFVLPEGITGDALFSEDSLYRHWLSRQRREKYKRYMLWVGLNPSTAGAKEDDPTTIREYDFTWKRGYRAYFKVNVCDFIATRPEQLMRADAPCSKENIKTIRSLAYDPKCAEIVLAFGMFRPELRAYMRRTTEVLKKADKPLICLGANKDGSPRHPLYLTEETQFIKWKEVLV